MKPYCLDGAAARSCADCRIPQGQKPNLIYDLVGVIVHQGRGINSGHYTSYCLNPTLGGWSHCNDARVKRATVEEVNKAQAYILIYSNRDTSQYVSQLAQAGPGESGEPPRKKQRQNR